MSARYDALMPVTISTISHRGLEGRMIQVEVDISAGLPSFTIVGLADAAVLEARERIRSAIKNSGYQFPQTRKVISLAPADVRKHGPAFDLAMAVGILAASKQTSLTHFDGVLLGELTLSGELLPIRGVVPLLLHARKAGVSQVIIPEKNKSEASIVEGIDVRIAGSLREVVEGLIGKRELRGVEKRSLVGVEKSDSDGEVGAIRDPFEGIVGQERAKRAIAIAAAGHHNILLSGPPGVGKSLLAHVISDLLPPLSYDEYLEVASIYSVRDIDLLREHLLQQKRRPVREIHHTSSLVSIIGGTAELLPGEISLAHRGVLVLDEISEFPRTSIEALRQPIEDGCVTLSRAAGTATYPAKFLLFATTNPCPCGFLNDPKSPCVCTQGSIHQYQRRISGPILDRIDLRVTMEPVNKKSVISHRSLTQVSPTSQALISAISRARARQRGRFLHTLHTKEPILTNSDLTAKNLSQYCPLDEPSQKTLGKAAESLNLSARSIHRIIKLARTIADMDQSQESSIESRHIAEALQYR